MLDAYFRNAAEAIDYGHTVGKRPANTDFHMHDRFEIYYFISGHVNYFIEKKVYSLKPGDLLVMNSNEIHRPHFLSDETYERIVVHFDPSLGKLFSPPGFDLLYCFNQRPRGEQNKINLSRSQLEELKKMLQRLEGISRSASDGADILKLTCFIELLVFINRAFMNIEPVEEQSNVPDKLIPVFEYIDKNLDSDLSLEVLENCLFINRFHLSRLFKQSTGINIHRYILYKRVSEAKRLLLSGTNVTEACQRSGFKDYSNFIRTFKRIVGISPGQYRKESSGM